MLKTLLILCLLLSPFARAQNVLVIRENSKLLNRSIADHFTIYSSPKNLNAEEFLVQKSTLTSRKLTQSVENLDFTTEYYYIHFIVKNETSEPFNGILETARPITNTVALYQLDINYQRPQLAGDAIPFSKKDILSNRSLLHINVDANSSSEYLLKLGSDGEIISLPMVFMGGEAFTARESDYQYFSGIFYGIFIFVIVIYLAFYSLLRDKLYLLYVLYVFFSGLLQFSLDGFIHRYVFTSGGYFTQHTIIFVAGFTVFFAYSYASRYLQLQGKPKLIANVLAALVLITTFASLIPGKVYELCYPLINGFSLLSLFFLLIVGFQIRKKDKSISLLFFVGLFALMIGALIFILGNFSVINVPILTQNSLKTGALIEIICLSILMAGKYKSLQDEKEKAQQQLLIELGEKNRLAAETNMRLEQEVKLRTKEIESQRIELKEKNEDFLASIKYAQRIQNALLPSKQKLLRLFPESFVIFKPKDIVSGDFYWFEEVTTSSGERLIVYATADCTGHGVPGAFVSLLCNNLLKLGKTNESVNTTGEALEFIDREINEMFALHEVNEHIQDGMDVAMCAFNQATNTLYFSGAKNGIYIVRNGELIQFKGDRKSIGFSLNKELTAYTTHKIKLEPGDMIYSFTDGIVDQFGGSAHKKFMTKRLKLLLQKVAHLSPSEQQMQIEEEIETWRKNTEQTDDMLLIGIRV